LLKKEPYKEPSIAENPRKKEKLINSYLQKLRELGVNV